MEEAQALALAEAALFAQAERDRRQYEGIPFDAMEASMMTESESQLSMDHHNQLGGFGMHEAELLENLMNLPDDESRHQLLQLLQQQEQQQLMQESLRMRPERHYLTISKEGTGTILEATETVTGFQPQELLMNSSYDLVCDDDLPGFLCIKTHFWDEGILDVEVMIRRRTVDGDWLWLASKAVDFNEQPVPNITLEETLIHDEEMAKRLNRIIRITAVLVQAVEAAWLTEVQAGESTKDSTASHKPALVPPPNSLVTEDVQAYQEWIQRITASGEHVVDDTLQRLLQLAATPNPHQSKPSEIEQEIIERFVSAHKKKTFDPFSMIESVRKGVRLDLGLTQLYPEEVKLITAVLIGMVPVTEAVPAVLSVLHQDGGLRALAMQLDSSLPTPQLSQSPESPSRKRQSIPVSLDAPVPPISVVNLSYTYIGNAGMEMLSELLHNGTTTLKSLDVSFCGLEEKGLMALARGFTKRKRNGLPYLRGVIISGNQITPKAAIEIGTALSPLEVGPKKRKPRLSVSKSRTGYDTDTDDDDFDDDDSDAPRETKRKCCVENEGLQVLHVACASLTPAALSRLLEGLGMHCPVKELNLASNNFGPKGANALVSFLETTRKSVMHKALPFLDRLDVSNNNLGDDGVAQLTRAIASKKTQVQIVDLKLSSNAIGPGGIETIMNKLLSKHELQSLSLDKNCIGDQGCQLVAASLQSLRSLSRLNLSFNQIGSRGINSLMRSLISCDSVTYLGLSGNILRITGAIALAFCLAQHPRLEELDLDNCCLGQAAQCHIAAGIISNRWVPMKRLNGFLVGPPMVAIGALKPYAAQLPNEDCFRIRKDEQMKTILQWTEENRNARRGGKSIDPAILAAAGLTAETDYQQSRFLTPDFVASINDVHGTPSQNAYFRLLGWLGQIPFDEDELTALQKYFFDSDGGEGDRNSDGYINLKLRGDLLAALDSEVADEFRIELPSLASAVKGSIGIDLDKVDELDWSAWKAFLGNIAEAPPKDTLDHEEQKSPSIYNESTAEGNEEEESDVGSYRADSSMKHVDSSSSINGRGKIKPRITMFPQFEHQLEELKEAATEMIEQEDDPMQHDIILTQYAEASLMILRQLRYHCMNSGIDGWRKGGLKRKVLIIDDSNVTRRMVSRAFEKADFIVDTASNGAEGVEKLKASIYDIAFMDIDMPVMDGFEATKKLREWEDSMRPGARQPICALTATYVDDFERSELMKFKEAGLDVMESKPCNIPRLFKVVDDVSPMFSDLSISIRRDRSDSKLSDSQYSDKSL
ncbi:hypothetical protein FisN_6Hh373 [Fistulifera solaris]|uniref:Response regulatory domain-containing protein n=1 Tax=Fistulifera solaris TaxID=1519565 RepID=A0A1Z5K7A2_FISSO|nr:hypothetical protein FisN_6Hh373 [Fistulifera solaris]|eukprot:GAX22124.1 hypothetical protein FisN_6Hh373 [Fistulifera solaris]